MNRLSTYFVETHEYNDDTFDCDLVEYFDYESEPFQGLSEIYAPTHHTILVLGVF